MLTYLAIIVSISGLISGLLPLLAIARMVRSRTSAGVSLGYVAGNLANAAVFGAYGIALGNLLIAFANLLWLSTGAGMFAVAAVYRRKAREAAIAEEAAWALVVEPRRRRPEPADADTLIIRPRVARATA